MAISKHRVNPAWKFLLPLLGVWLLLYGSYALVRPALPDGPGALHAEIAREMLARHDWSSAYVNGSPFRSPSRTVDWTVATGFRLFGVSDWSARLPNALCVLVLAVIAFLLGRQLFVWNAAGLYAALLVLVWPGTFAATRGLTAVPLSSALLAIVLFVLWRVPAFGRVKATWLLSAWVVAASLLGPFLEAQPRNPLAWLGPVLPVALLLGGWLANREAFGNTASSRRLAYTIFALGLLISAALIYIAVVGPVGFSLFSSSMVITAGPGRIPFVILAAAFIAGVTGNLVYRLHRNPRAANCFLAGLLAGITVAIQAALVVAAPQRSSQVLADAIRPELNATDIVLVDGTLADASSFIFYLQHPVRLTGFGAPDHAASEPATNDNAIQQVWNGTSRVYLWTRTDHPPAMQPQSYVIASTGSKQVLSNRPNSSGASF